MKFVSQGFLAGVTLLLSVSASAQDVSLDTDEKKLGYAIGFSIGQMLVQQFGGDIADLDKAAVAAAIGHVLKQEDPALGVDEIQSYIQNWQQQRQAEQQAAAAEHAEQAQAALEKGQAFLKENGARDGIVTTDSGLQYEIKTAGDGKQPSAEDTVTVHYAGRLIDGTEFDSSYKRNNPTTFQVAGVIRGWQEALQLMKAGAKWTLYIPAELAYGERGGGSVIGPNEVLVFDVELLEVK